MSDTYEHQGIKLSEKLPKDLAKAYNSATLRDLKGMDYEIPTKTARRFAKIDLNAADYAEITKDEAKKIFRSPDKWKLRIILLNDHLVMYDRKTGKMLTTSVRMYGEDPSSVSFDRVLSLAKKIYKTDEDEHVINRQSAQRPDVFDFDAQTKKDVQDWYYHNLSSSNMNNAAFYADSYWAKRDSVQDTGDHTMSWADSGIIFSSRAVKILKHNIQAAEKEYNGILKSLNGSAPNEWQSVRMDKLKDQINYTKKLLLHESGDLIQHKLNALRGGINKELAKAVLLRGAMNYKKSKFAQSLDNINGSKFQMLCERAEELKAKIKALQDELNGINDELTPELKQQAIDEANEKSLALGDDYLNLQAQFDALKDKYKKSE